MGINEADYNRDSLATIKLLERKRDEQRALIEDAKSTLNEIKRKQTLKKEEEKQRLSLNRKIKGSTSDEDPKELVADIIMLFEGLALSEYSFNPIDRLYNTNESQNVFK